MEVGLAKEPTKKKKKRITYLELRTRRILKTPTSPCGVRRRYRSSTNYKRKEGSGSDSDEEPTMGKWTAEMKEVEEEIEEFLAAAGRAEAKRLADKYNFDFAQEMPLQGGRYQWMQI